MSQTADPSPVLGDCEVEYHLGRTRQGDPIVAILFPKDFIDLHENAVVLDAHDALEMSVKLRQCALDCLQEYGRSE